VYILIDDSVELATLPLVPQQSSNDDKDGRLIAYIIFKSALFE